MKKLMKRLLATALSAAMLLGIGVGVSAAEPLSVQVGDTKVAIVQGDKEITSYSIKSSDITLSTNSGKKLIVRFKDAAGKTRNISLGSQTTLRIGGKIASLTLDKSLASATKITIASGAVVSKLTVHAGCTVTAATDAKISKLTSSNKKATLQTAAGKKLTATSVSAPVSAKKPATTTKKPAASTSTDSGIRLTVKSINASEGDTLDNLLDQLNENVTARDGVDHVLGECKWNYSTDREITDDITLSFTFYPDTNDYEPVKGSVKVYADGNSEDIRVEFKTYSSSNPILAKDGDRLSSFTQRIKDDLYVENDSGEKLKYSLKWESASNTKFSNTDPLRSYTFTIKPTSSRYLETEMTIYVQGESA